MDFNKQNKGLMIDISLLAIVIALHLTNKDKNLELIVMGLLLAHLIITMSGIRIGMPESSESSESSETPRVGSSRVGVAKLDNTVATGKGNKNGSGTTRGEVITTQEISKLDLNDDFEFVPKRSKNSSTLGTSGSESSTFLGKSTVNFPQKPKPKAEPVFRKSVSDSGFERAFSVPKEASKTNSDVLLPSSGSEANLKLADSRTSFFDKMFKNI